MRSIRVFGSRCGYRCGNAGDELSPLLVSALSGLRASWSGIGVAHLTVCGSILDQVPPEYSGHVWGSGLMFEHSRLVANDAKVAAVRGLFTAARIPQRRDYAIGDPGLLIADLYPVERTHVYPIGFVPHYVDSNDMVVTEWLRRNPEWGTVIDICQHPEQVLRQIAECDYIVSSSLHGLVFADALEIPNSWVRLSDGVNGAGFKFRDYWSAFGIADIPSIPFTVDTKPEDIVARAGDYHRPGLERIKDDLVEAFPCPA